MTATDRLLALLAAGLVSCGGGRSSPPGALGGSDGGSPSTGTDGGNPGGTDGGPVAGQPAEPAPGPDWPQYRHDAAGRSVSGDSLSVADLPALRELWSQEVGSYGYSQPVRAGDAIFVATSVLGRVYALDAASGRIRWTRDLHSTVHSECAAASGEWKGGDNAPGIWGSPAVQGDSVYVGAPDGTLQALDAQTGETRFAASVAHPSPHAELIESSVALTPATAQAWVGVGAVAHCDPVQGRIAGVDLVSEQVTTRAFVDGGQLGAALWSTPSVDESDGTLYVATGNAVGDPAGEPLAQAVIALDPVTLTPRAHWQNPAPGLQNCDFGASPTLFDADGKKLLAVASKDGWLYALDRTRLGDGPVWKRQLAVIDAAHPTQCGDPLQGSGASPRRQSRAAHSTPPADARRMGSPGRWWPSTPRPAP